MSNVIPFHKGDVVIATGEPRESVIKAIEDLLERARSGDIQGMAYAALYHDSLASWGIVGLCGPHSLIGAVEVMKANLIRKETN